MFLNIVCICKNIKLCLQVFTAQSFYTHLCLSLWNFQWKIMINNNFWLLEARLLYKFKQKLLCRRKIYLITIDLIISYLNKLITYKKHSLTINILISVFKFLCLSLFYCFDLCTGLLNDNIQMMFRSFSKRAKQWLTPVIE